MMFYTYHPMVDYFNTMDSESYGRAAPPLAPEKGERADFTETGYGIKDVGMSVPFIFKSVSACAPIIPDFA